MLNSCYVQQFLQKTKSRNHMQRFAEDIEKYLNLYFVYTLKQQFIRFTSFL